MKKSRKLQLHVGVKTDPIEYRYSFEWLFRILRGEGIRHVQIGTFFELYHLPDEWFRGLRARADDFGLTISSVFTSHRELGGFFRGDPAWEAVARRNFERLIEICGILGARTVGSNPGSVPRDRIGLKRQGTVCYLRHMKDLMILAREAGLEALTVEPMSCLAEPPTLPGEMREMVEALQEYHDAHPDETSTVGLCADVSHGYADRDGKVVHGHMELLEAALPYTREIHLKNTDERFLSTFGFTEDDRRRGVVDVAAVRDLLRSKADALPTADLVGYLEISGPKLGRDSSDVRLERELRESLRYLKDVFTAGGGAAAGGAPAERAAESTPGVRIAPSLMCAEMGHLAGEIERLERSGCDWLHFDIMDAHFVPNMPVGLTLLEGARKLTSLPFDVHLMVDNNDFFIERLRSTGVEYVSVHVESSVHLDRTLDLIHSIGARAGAALNPATPLSELDYVLDRLDYVLIMTVNPGYAGQKLVPSAFQKIRDTYEYLRRHGLEIPIEVDGNVSFENIPRMVASGAGILVAGTSSLFRSGAPLDANLRRMREGIRDGLRDRPDAEPSP